VVRALHHCLGLSTVLRKGSGGQSVKNLAVRAVANIAQLKLLIADDAPIARKMVERSLSAMCRECHHAINGRDAVDKVAQSMQPGEQPYDVILMDYYMPVMSGPEAVKLIREQGYKGILLAVTGATSNSEQALMLNHGVDSILLKPLSLDAFRKTVHGERK